MVSNVECNIMLESENVGNFCSLCTVQHFLEAEPFFMFLHLHVMLANDRISQLCFHTDCRKRRQIQDSLLCLLYLVVWVY